MPSPSHRFFLSAILVLAAQLGCAKAEPRAAGGAVGSGQAAGRVAADTGSRSAADSISVAADRNRTRGDTAAKVWVIMISDFQCPYCKRWHDESYARLLREYVATKKVRLAYLNFPLAIHPNAVPAAEAAMCASAQGKFWEMHDALFAAQDTWGRQANPTASISAVAAKVRLDIPVWRDCMNRHATRAVIDEDRRRGEQARVESTPTFFVGTGRMLGAQPYDSLRVLIESQLAAAGKGR